MAGDKVKENSRGGKLFPPSPCLRRSCRTSWRTLALDGALRQGVNDENYAANMPCEKYKQLRHLREIEMITWAQYTYPENQHLRRGVSDREAKLIANEAQSRATEKGKEMEWHRASCEECKRDSGA